MSIEENRRETELNRLYRIEKAATDWLDFFDRKQRGKLDQYEEMKFEQLRRFLASEAVSLADFTQIPGIDFADVVLALRRRAIHLQAELFLGPTETS